MEERQPSILGFDRILNMVETDDRAVELVARSLCQAAGVDPDRSVVVNRVPMTAWETMKQQAAMFIAGVLMVKDIYTNE